MKDKKVDRKAWKDVHRAPVSRGLGTEASLVVRAHNQSKEHAREDMKVLYCQCHRQTAERNAPQMVLGSQG